MKTYITVITCLIFAFFLTAYSQPTPSDHYNVFNKDSIYIFTSDTHLLIFSCADENGNFKFLSAVPGSYNVNTRIVFNGNYFLLINHHNLYLYNLSDPYNPNLVSEPHFGFNVDHVYNFEPYFIFNSNHILKLIDIQNDSLIVKEDSMITLDPTYTYYPYIIRNSTIYKYVEGFGTYAVYTMNYNYDWSTDWKFGAGNKYYYHVVVYNPPFPPTICNLRIRLIQEPDFPLITDDVWWADCAVVDGGYFFEGSSRYIYLWVIGNHQYVFNIPGGIAYEFPYNEWSEFRLHLTDTYIFKLGAKIYYSVPLNPSEFSELVYSLTPVAENKPGVENFILKNNYPNPFNPSTTIEYSVPENSYVKLTVTNLLGEKVALLVDEEKPAGNYKVTFDGTNLPSGVYIYTLSSGSKNISKKMILMK